MKSSLYVSIQISILVIVLFVWIARNILISLFLKSRKWEEEQYQKYLAQGNLEQAELFKPSDEVRETNPAEFELSDFASIENASFPESYEEDYSEECWETATPILSEVAQIAYKKVKEELRIHPLFELAINGEEDWYYPIIPIE